MASVMSKEGFPVAYHVPVVVKQLDIGVFLAKNDSLGIFIQGDSKQYVLDQFFEALKGYTADCPDELESFKDADIQVVDL